MLTASGIILDEIDMTPPGYLYTIAIASYFKRALVTIEMPVAERLHFLEAINGWVDGFFTERALAAIEPACKTGAEMIRECMKVDRPDDWKRGRSLDLMASREVFGHLVGLNPSLLTAIQLCGPGRGPAPAGSPPAEKSPPPKASPLPAPVYWPGIRWPVA
jgi:hypothetical protein